MPSTAPTSGWRSGGWRCATSSHIRSRASRLTTARPATASSYATAPSVPDSSGSPGRLTSATGTSASEQVQGVVWQLVSVRVSVQGRRKDLCAPRRTLEGRVLVCEPLEWTRESNHLECVLNTSLIAPPRTDRATRRNMQSAGMFDGTLNRSYWCDCWTRLTGPFF